MVPDPPPDAASDRGDDPADLAALAAYAEALAAGIVAAVPGWAERVVAERVAASGRDPRTTAPAARAAGRAAAEALGPRLRALLATDVDAQVGSPLEIVRGIAPVVTAVLTDAGVPPVVRDEVAVRLHPADLHDLGPASVTDLDPDLRDAAIAWGAAKAHVILARRRREGRR